MIDIHTHIMPGLDDGASDIIETLEMAMMAAETGVKAIVATPHCNIPGLYNNFYTDEYVHAYKSVVKMIEAERIPLQILPGMEVFATYDLPDLLVDKKIMPLNQSRYVLIEFDFEEDPDFATDLLRRVSEVGAKPIIAHAERYEFVQDNPDIVYDWRNAGYYIQANKGSFLGRFGKRAEKAVYQLMDHNLISVIASDAHSALRRTTVMVDAYEELCKYYSRKHLEVLFKDNPARICNNQPLIVQKPMRIINDER